MTRIETNKTQRFWSEMEESEVYRKHQEQVKLLFWVLLLFVATLISCKNEPVEPTNTPNIRSYNSYVIAYDTPGNGNIYLYNSFTKTLSNITSHVVDTLYYAYVSSFSDDGHQLLFTLDYEKQGKEDLLFCDRDDIFCYNTITGKIKRITDTEYREVNPVFSKDGQHIIYESYENGNSDIYMIDTSGNNKRLLVSNPGYEHYPHFIMNDQKILYTSMRNFSTDFYLNDINGQNEERLTYDTWSKSNPSISSDNNFFIYSASDDMGNVANRDRGIFKYDFNTKTTTLLIPPSSNILPNMNPKISDDAQYIVYLHFDGSWSHVYLTDSGAKSQIDLGIGFVADFTNDSKDVISLQSDGMHKFNINTGVDSILVQYQILSFDMAVSSIK